MPLTQEQQNRLNELKSRQQQLLLQQQGQQAVDANLMGQLKGRLSTFESLGIQKGQPRTGTIEQQFQPDPRFMTPRQRLEELNRRKAELQLLKGGKTKEQIQFVLDVNKRLVPSTVGRTVGGIAGAIAAPLALNLIPGFAALPEEIVTIPLALMKTAKAVAPILGAGIGGGLGEATQTGIEEKRLISKETFLKAFGKEAAFEAGGRAFVRTAKFAFAPFIKQAIPEAADVITEFSKVGGVLTPSQLDKRLSLSITDEIIRGGFATKQIFQDLGEKSGRAAVVYADTLLDRMAGGVARLGNEQLGREFAEGITRPRGKVFQMLDDLFNPLYKQVDELSKGARFSTAPLKRFAQKELAGDKALNKLILSPQGRAKFLKIVGLPEDISAAQVRNLRSSFLKDIRKLARDVNKDEGLIKQVASITDDILFDTKAVRGLTPEADNLLRNTNRLYRTAQIGLKETFPEQLGKRLIKNPSSVTKELFPQNNPKAIRNLRQSLVEPISGRRSAEGVRQWLQLRTAWFADAVDGATRGDIVKPAVFELALRRMGKPAIKEMLPDDVGKKQLQTIRNLLKAMSRKPEGGASLFIRGGQVGGLFMMYNGTKEGDWLQVSAGGALVAGPYFFAKMAAHPLGSRLMATGIKLKPGSTSLVPITARLVNLSRQIDIQEIRNQIAARRDKKVSRARPIAPSLQQLRGFGGRGF